MSELRSRPRFDGSLPKPRSTPGVSGKAAAAKDLAAIGPELAALQERLHAGGKHGDARRVLLVLQGMDASGKDGAMKHVLKQVNPLGCRITAFGRPTKEELAHDFLWRTKAALPTAGQIGVFNRSHYEDVLIVRVRELVPLAVSSRRFGRINTFEKHLVGSGCSVVKVFLHMSWEEQGERLLARLDDPSKHWKVGEADVKERARWAEYQAAYLEALTRCSTDVAPWYVVPADRKWYRDWAVSQLLLESLRDMDLSWPEPEGLDLKAIKKELMALKPSP